MKICVLNLYIYSLFNSSTKNHFGGAEIQLYFLINYLAKNSGMNLSIITGDWGQKKIEEYNKIKIYRSTLVKKSILDYLYCFFKIWSLLKKINANVYIVSSVGPEAPVLSLFCKVYKKKLIYRSASKKDCDLSFIKKSGILGKFFQYMIENADIVTAQHKENKKLLKKNHNIDAQIIKNAFVIKEEINYKNKKNYILWVGRMIPGKHPEIFLKLVKKFHQQEFIMIAPLDSHHPAYFEKIYNKTKKIKNLTFIKKVPFSKIQKYYDEAKILVCTSRTEGFPNVHLQSLLGKTPIVTLNINPDNYINKNKIGYFAQGDFELFTKQIKKILSDEKDWQEKSKNAFKYVEKNHDIEKIGRQWEKMLYKVLEK